LADQGKAAAVGAGKCGWQVRAAAEGLVRQDSARWGRHGIVGAACLAVDGRRG
jgi:hypothetical protein